MENKKTNTSACANTFSNSASKNFSIQKNDFITTQTPTLKQLQSLKTLNQRGFITIASIMLLSLIISSSISILTGFWFLMTKQKAELLCQKHILQTQTHLIDGTHELLKLNPQAEALILEKKFLEFSIKMNPNPVQKAIEAARLAIVIAQMNALRTLQKTILLKAEQLSIHSAWNYRQQLHKLIHEIQNQWKSSQKMSPRILTHITSIQLIPIFKDPLLPIYTVPMNFEDLQTQRFQMRFQAHRLFPDWIPLSKMFSEWRESCVSQPQKQGVQQWIAALKRDKLFLRL